MTTTYLQEYQRCTDGIKHISTGIYSKCQGCQRQWGMGAAELEAACQADEVTDEGGFSGRRCEGCGSGLGGNRYAAHGFTDDNTVVHLDVCEDCLIYIANGDEPKNWE